MQMVEVNTKNVDSITREGKTYLYFTAGFIPFAAAMEPVEAKRLYEYFVDKLEAVSGKRPATGVFSADMQVRVDNDGPVTIIMDTDEIMKKKK